MSLDFFGHFAFGLLTTVISLLISFVSVGLLLFFFFFF